MQNKNDNIENIIIEYFSSYLEFHSIIQDKAKGDWNKAELLIKNDKHARQIWDKQREALKKFRLLSSEVGFLQIGSEYHSLYKQLKRLAAIQDSYTQIAGFLEHFRDEWEGKIEDGDIEDGDLLDALDAFFNLPNYDPDSWLRRNFMLGGVLLLDDSKEIPKRIEKAFKEACVAYLYGLNLAAISVSRSVLESALKECFPDFPAQTLGEFISKNWFKIEKLRDNLDLEKKARHIMQSGNDALHEKKNEKVSALFNELKAKTVLMDLREILKFLYR